MFPRIPYVNYVFRHWLVNVILATVSLSDTSSPGLLTKGVAPSRVSTTSSGLLLPSHANSSSLLLETPFNDWEYFAYPIPGTNQILKGHIFTSRLVRPSSL